MLFNKILLAYDGSKASIKALGRAVELVKVTRERRSTLFMPLSSRVFS